MTTYELTKVAGLALAIAEGMQKTAAGEEESLLNRIGTRIGNTFEKLKPSENLQTAMKGAGRGALDSADRAIGRAGEYLEPKLKDAGRMFGNGLLAKDLRTGIRYMKSGLNAKGGVNQGRFNAGLKKAIKGVGKTGLAWGGLLYAGNRLAGANKQNQQMHGGYLPPAGADYYS